MPYKILIIPGYELFPVASGGAHGQLTFIKEQQYQHDITLILTPSNIIEASIESFQKEFPKVQLCKVGFSPMSVKEKVKRGVYKQIRKSSGKDISYFLWKQPYTSYIMINNPQWLDGIANVAAGDNFDLIQVEHSINMGLVSILPAGVKKIFVHHEVLHTKVIQDMKSNRYNDAFSRYITGFMEGAEFFWLGQYDGVITFNKEDKELLTRKGLDKKQMVASPFVLNNEELKNIYKANARPHLLFMGGEAHYPNKEGLLWFLNEVLPFIRQNIPHVQLYITSDWSEEFKKQFQDSHIIFTGYVENLDDLLTTAINIIPIRLGSGIRVKAYTSIAKGIPMVSTSLGVSGLPHLMHSENIMLADEAPDFAQAVIDIIQDIALRKKLSTNAFETAKQNFKAGEFVQNRNNFYKEVIEG
jgi:glycosyltransferase involved in cell wall biosynthesis